ncbi:hypothetical protein [Sphingomonas sp. GC_Shp_3]|uniref:hypothetical protein n=1 Tax=Sphingomonas sp. GC_Shp_3 TaxID=2937383 RepID=UPI00226AA826|nr:hypothetical protein [Sphingomonas sp. GC_Shp_3]
MLRTLVLVAAMLAFTAALIVVSFVPLQWPLLVWTGVALFGILFERARYGSARRQPTGNTWRETPERFVDDASGRVMVVWFDAVTGERRYVDTAEQHNATANDLH